MTAKNGSRGYLGVLESLRELFERYPVRADMSSVHVALDPAGRASVLVWLRPADPVVLAAGIVEWRRTLAGRRSWAWRTPGGEHLHISTAGHAPECDELSVAVLAGPIPHDCCLDVDLEPDVPEVLDDDVLYRWLGDEIANDWPFDLSGAIS